MTPRTASAGGPDAGTFRAAMARFPTGVTVTTVTDGEGTVRGLRVRDGDPLVFAGRAFSRPQAPA